MKKFYPLFFTFFIILCCFGARPLKPQLKPFKAEVKWIYDGDSFKAGSRGSKFEVRLYGIDAPEKLQPYGKASLKNLIKLIKYKTIIVEPLEKDHYGRLIAKVYILKKVNKQQVKLYINLCQVEAGMAWWYKKYAPKESVLEKAQNKARKKRIGLWAQKNPENPSSFRRRTH